MVRETRHLWVGNLPENIREDRIREHFKRYGRVQSVKLLSGTGGGLCAAVAFMDIKSAAKAHNCDHTLDEHALSTEYYEPGPYTATQQRFPIGGGEEHPTFERTSHFYDRGTSTPVTALANQGARPETDSYSRRPSAYHAPLEPIRGRPRERLYRNGPPYGPGAERSSGSNHHRAWNYDSTSGRYLNSSDDHGVGPVKTKKVRSGSESRSGSQSSRSRSPTRSTTGSPRSSDSSTRSESPRSTRVSVQSTVAPPVQQTQSSTTLAVYSEDRRPLAICVRNLPTRSSDTSLKDGLFHEYKKHGKVTWVKVVGAANERYALVCFKKPEDVEKAIEVSQDKLFFGCKIDVAPYHGYDVEDNEARPYDTELDEYHPKATRTLFIGNLEKDVTAADIRQTFDKFGEIIEIDIKKQSGVALSYAFCQYADIGSVVQAIRTLDGEPLGGSRLKLGFGKSMASSCVWIAGVAEQMSDKLLDIQFRKFGSVSGIVVDRERGQALIFYEQVPAAAAAVKEMRGMKLRGQKIQIDFASRECQEAFYERVDIQARDRGDNTWSSFDTSRSERDLVTSRYDSGRFRYDAPRVRSSSYSRSSGGRTPRRHEVYDSPRYKSYEDLSPSSDYDDYAPNEAPDLRHLHKERNHIQHLLDQLDRPLRSVTAADQGLVVTTHNHKRRLSSHRRSSGEGPAPICKRRKTGSTSEDERKRHHHHHSGDESRPGTPLFDEKPDNIQPQEPRRVPRERPEEPLSLPLPQFAAHCFSNVKASSVNSSSPAANASGSIATNQQAPPASPARPPSPSSTSSSEISPQSPTLEERIRSLDEKYEKWTGRTLQPPTKPKHRLLDVDVRELQPSDIVKSVLAKPSVFDEDSKRLENFGEKYEPRDFSSYPRAVGLDVQRFVPGDPRNPSYIPNLSVKVSPLNSPSGAVLSPCPAAKGLQYPFPSHPPVQPTTSVATTTAGSPSPPTPATRPISRSMEFSVQKAEDWLGITKSGDASSQKESYSACGGSYSRFNVHAKAPEQAIQRHNTVKSVDNSVQKSDTVQKSVDPRLGKSGVVSTATTTATTTTTSVLTQRIAVKSAESETVKGDGNAHVLKFAAAKITDKTKEESVNASKSNRMSWKSEESGGTKGIESKIQKDFSAFQSEDKVEGSALSGSGDSLSAEKIAGIGSYVAEASAATTKADVDVPSGLLCESGETEKTRKNKDLDNSLQTHESTKKLESSSVKSNHSHVKAESVIIESDLSQPGVSARAEGPKSATGSRSGTSRSGEKLDGKTKISENCVKVVSENDKIQSSGHISVSRDESVPFNIRDKESGGDKVKFVSKEKDKCASSSREEKTGNIRDVDREKAKDKVASERDEKREREKEKGMARERQKEREMPENVDKERKKDREVESERKKDRESMEVIEREKRREEETEKDRKKEHLDILDRRKDGGDRKSLDHDKSKKKEEEKERRKEKESSDKEKRKDQHSEKHRKGSDERKKETDIDSEKSRDGKKKDRSGSQPAVIGSKRRISSQDSAEGGEDGKRPKLDHKRRDSKDSKSNSGSNFSSKTSKSEHRSQETKSSESKHKSSSDTVSDSKSSEARSQEHKRKEDSERKRHQSSDSLEKKKDSMKKIQIKLEDVLKPSNDLNGKGSCSSSSSSSRDGGEKIKEQSNASESYDEKKHGMSKKESKERKKISKKEFGSTESLDDKKLSKKEKKSSGSCGTDKKKEDEGSEEKRSKEKSKVESRKENGHYSASDSDSEPKKHSIFDIVIDEPAYISMYDKVKARSCKNMQKQEEEKRQGMLGVKEKFTQLKQSRAKREEKKRSTSWDEDSDSDASQVRRLPSRSFSRLSSEDEGSVRREKKTSESWDNDNRRGKKMYDTSEDEGGVKPKAGRLHASEIYSDESDVGFADNPSEKPCKKFASKSKPLLKNMFESSEEDSPKKQVLSTNSAKATSQKPEKINSESKNKVRLSLDSSTERFTQESKSKKRTVTESMSEGEPTYHSNNKSPEKLDRKKSKKKEKRQKSLDDESKHFGSDLAEKSDLETKSDRKKQEKRERRKSIQSAYEETEESGKQKKKKSPRRGNTSFEPVQKGSEDSKLADMFDNFSDDSNDNSQSKFEVKSNPSKWHMSQIYGTDSDSNFDPVDSIPSITKDQQRKGKEKKKREKKTWETNDELLQAGRALEQMLASPPSRRDSDENVKQSENCDEAEKKSAKEKKKKRKKSKEEKSSRHHHHHHHHYFKQEAPAAPSSSPPSRPPDNAPVLAVVVKQEQTPRSPSPSLSAQANSKKGDKLIPGFNCEMDEKIHESAVQSISLVDVPKVEPKNEVKEEVEDVPEPMVKSEEGKERTVISQEETEDAVAALLGETFTFSPCFEGNSPVEPEQESHDEEEMRQAVRSLNEGKPDTPQSESDLQIDTDAEETEEHFSNGLRFDSLPRTPDLDLSRPPKTPDIQPSYFVEAKPTAFPRKDTTRNSREEMEVPIVGPASPEQQSIEYARVEEPEKPKERDLKPPVLKPASPKLFRGETTAVESMPAIKSPERIYVDNRLLLAPPPLVPVTKQVSSPPPPPRSSPNISLVRPMISLSTNTAPALVLTPIRTTTSLAVSTGNSALPKKAFAAPTSIIATSRSSVSPQVLSPITPCSPTPPKSTASAFTQSLPTLTNTPKFTTTTTIVSPRNIPGHLISQKIIVHQVPKLATTQQRLVTTPTSMVQIVDPSLHPKKTEMPPLETVVTTRPSPAVFTTALPTLAQVPVTTTTTATSAPATSAFDISRSSLIQTSSIISVVSRSSLPSTTRFATSSIITQATPTPNLVQTSSMTSVRPLTTPVISVHPNLPSLVQSKPNSSPCQVSYQSVVTSPKTTPHANFQTSVISSTGFSQAAEIPKGSGAVSDPAPARPASPEAAPVRIDRESSDDEKKVEFQKLVAELESEQTNKERPRSPERKDSAAEVKVEVAESVPMKENVPTVLVEVPKEESVLEQPPTMEMNPVFEQSPQTESVIKKVDSLLSLKSEESVDENLPIGGDKSDTSSVNQDDISKTLSSEEDTRQAGAARKGRKKVTRGAGASRRTRNSGGKPEATSTASSSRKAARGARGGKSSGDAGKRSTDIYEFHDESDEEGDAERDRPRLILTIKSPNGAKDPATMAAAATAAKPCSTIVKSPNSVTQAKSPGCVKSPKESIAPVKSPEQKSPTSDGGTLSTRKSRRLQEKDVSRNTVDDVIEDVIRNGGPRNASSPRRSSRQVVKMSSSQPLSKKIGTRGAKKLARCPSTDDEVTESETITSKTPETANAVDSKEAKSETPGKEVEEQEAEGGETSDEEPTTLIDPVTGMLMVMRAKEEGKYVPVPNAQPVAPPTPPPPASKPENLPIVNEGLASHWLTQETLKVSRGNVSPDRMPSPDRAKTMTIPVKLQQAVMKAQHFGESNKINQVYMNRPPTPPTTPQTKLPDTLTRFPADVIKKLPQEVSMEADCMKQEKDVAKPMIHPVELAKHKMPHLEQAKYVPEINRLEYQEMNRSVAGSPEPGKMMRQLTKAPIPTNLVKAHCAKAVAVVLPPNKQQIYPNAKKMQQSQILTGAAASSPPRVVKASPPAHELHPMTGAVASPPPRAPHLASQQPVVTGASSSRALVDAPKGSAASSPRGLTIPQFESPLHASGPSLYSPPPAHQQGEGVGMGHLGHPQFVHPQLVYQQYLRAQEMLPSPYQLTSSLQGKIEERERERGAGDMCRSPPLELRSQRATDSPTVYMGRQHYTRYYDDPPPAHLPVTRHVHQVPDPPGQPRLQVATPPHASQVPPQADSLLLLLQRYPIMWQGLLALKNDQSAVQMHFVFGNPIVARDSLPCNSDGSTPPLRIAQRMRLEQTQLEGVARKMQMDHEHCMLLALPCGRDHMDVLQQSTNLQTGFITYLQQKQAAGIVNIAHPGSQQAAYVVHIFPSCEFANENLARNAPDLLHRMQEIPHLVIVIATV